MVSKVIAGDPNGFAGVSEHSQQVALMAAVAHYAKYFREQIKTCEPLLESAVNGIEATDRWAEVKRCERLALALEWLHAVPNGGTRGGDKRSAMIAGANMKAEGAKTGVSDLMLCAARHGYHGFAIEMKKPGNLKGESEEQKRYGEYLRSEGYLYAVFDNWWGAMRAIMWYLDFAHCLEWELPS